MVLVRGLILTLLLLAPRAVFAEGNRTRFVAQARSGIAAGYEFLGADPRFTGRLGLGAGFIDLRSGGGVLFGADLTGGRDPGLGFGDSLRLEASVHIWTPKGALRLFGGSRLSDDAPFGGVALGLPIPVPVSERWAVGVIPEIGVWIGKGANDDVDVLLMVQALFDVYFLVH